jgi:hypothetical protein
MVATATSVVQLFTVATAAVATLSLSGGGLFFAKRPKFFQPSQPAIATVAVALGPFPAKRFPIPPRRQLPLANLAPVLFHPSIGDGRGILPFPLASNLPAVSLKWNDGGTFAGANGRTTALRFGWPARIADDWIAPPPGGTCRTRSRLRRLLRLGFCEFRHFAYLLRGLTPRQLEI